MTGRVLRYDYKNRLTEVKLKATSASIVTYKYDTLGRRVEKAVVAGAATTRYALDGQQVIEEFDGTDTWQASYVYEDGIDQPRCMDRADIADVDSDLNTVEVFRFHYHQNALGSVYEMTDPAGAVVEWCSYDVYGAATVRSQVGTVVGSSAIGNPFLYTGREFDPESGKYFYRARTYDPVAGRFLQRDPLGYIDGKGLYEYVGSGPSSYRDPTGTHLDPGSRGNPDGRPTDGGPQETRRPEGWTEYDQIDARQRRRQQNIDRLTGIADESYRKFERENWVRNPITGKLEPPLGPFGPFPPTHPDDPRWFHRVLDFLFEDHTPPGTAVGVAPMFPGRVGGGMGRGRIPRTRRLPARAGPTKSPTPIPTPASPPPRVVTPRGGVGPPAVHPNPPLRGGPPNGILVKVRNGRPVQSWIYDHHGNVIGHVDWGPHGRAPCGHGHTFPPGNPAPGHRNPNAPHWNPGQLPPDWHSLPPGLTPRTPIGK